MLRLLRISGQEPLFMRGGIRKSRLLAHPAFMLWVAALWLLVVLALSVAIGTGSFSSWVKALLLQYNLV